MIYRNIRVPFPLTIKERYDQHRRIPRCETALQPRSLEITPKDLK